MVLLLLSMAHGIASIMLKPASWLLSSRCRTVNLPANGKSLPMVLLALTPSPILATPVSVLLAWRKDQMVPCTFLILRKVAFGESCIMVKNSGLSSSNQLASSDTGSDAEENTVPEELAAGQALYKMHCQACHMNDGKGVPGMNPPLVNTDWVTGDKERLIGVVLKGMNEPIEVNGETYQNMMASFAHLSDSEIAEILTYVRSVFGSEAGGVTVEEVAEVRGGI